MRSVLEQAPVLLPPPHYVRSHPASHIRTRTKRPDTPTLHLYHDLVTQDNVERPSLQDSSLDPLTVATHRALKREAWRRSPSCRARWEDFLARWLVIGFL